MRTFERTLELVKRQHPGVDDDEARSIAHDWLADAAEEDRNREDTPSIEDTMPEEMLALRRELRS